MLLGAFLVALGSLIGIVAEDYEPARLAPVFMLLSWFPLIALHELGHAAAARLVGWRVHRIVVGFGKAAARFELFGVPLTLKLYPLGGYVSPAPVSMRGVRLKSAFIYAAGPGAELALVGLLVLALGPEAMLERTEDIPQIAVQSVAITALLSVVMNLAPRRIQTEHGPSATDGWGIIGSFVRPKREYLVQVRSTHEARILEATDAEATLRAAEDAYRHMGDDAHVRSVMVAALEARGAEVSGRALPPRVLDRLGTIRSADPGRAAGEGEG